MPVAAPLIGGAASIAGSLLSKPKAAQDPNAYLKPYLTGAASEAQSLYQSGGPEVYQGPTQADLSDPTRMALDNTFNRATQGSAVSSAAKNYVTQGLGAPISTMFGQGTSNPGLDAAFNYAAQKTQNRLSSEYARSGRNVDASAPARADVLSNLAAQIYAPAYEAERNRGAVSYENSQNRALQDLSNQRSLQQGLLNYATPLAQQDYMDLAAQRNVGQFYDTRAQNDLNASINQFNQLEQQPYSNFNQYLDSLNSLKSATGPAVAPAPKPNYLAAGIGGALAGQELYGQYGSNALAPVQITGAAANGGYQYPSGIWT